MPSVSFTSPFHPIGAGVFRKLAPVLWASRTEGVVRLPPLHVPWAGASLIVVGAALMLLSG